MLCHKVGMILMKLICGSKTLQHYSIKLESNTTGIDHLNLPAS